MIRRLSALSSFVVLSFFVFGASAQEQTPAPPAPTAAPPPPAPAPAPGPPPAPAGTSPSAAVGPTPQEVQARRVQTTIESGSEHNAVIERRVSTEESNGRMLFAVPFRATSETWEQVCVAPCRVDLDRYSTYRVARGNNVTSTHEFTLPPNTDQLHLRVEPGSLLTHRIATRLIAGGTAALIVGGALITTASSFVT